MISQAEQKANDKADAAVIEAIQGGAKSNGAISADLSKVSTTAVYQSVDRLVDSGKVLLERETGHLSVVTSE